MEEKTPEGVRLYIPAELRGGHYANLVQAQISKSEVQLSFFLVNNNDEPQGTMVGRIIMSRDSVQNLAIEFRKQVEENKERDPE